MKKTWVTCAPGFGVETLPKNT